MNDERSFERTARAWLEPGANQAPDRAIQAVLLAIETTPQERDLGIPWRLPTMNTPVRVGMAAVIGLLLLGGAYYLFGSGTGPDVGAPGRTPTSTTLPFPTGTPGERVPPGTYALDLLAASATTGAVVPMRITFTVPDGWLKNRTPTMLWADDNRRFGFFTVDNLYADPCDPSVDKPVRDPPLGPTVADLVAALKTMANLTASAPSEIALSGFSGTQLDLAISGATCSDDYQAIWASPQGGPITEDSVWAMSPNERGRVLVLDVDGARVAVVTANGTDATESQRAEIQSIVNTVRIEVGDSAASPIASP